MNTNLFLACLISTLLLQQTVSQEFGPAPPIGVPPIGIPPIGPGFGFGFPFLPWFHRFPAFSAVPFFRSPLSVASGIVKRAAVDEIPLKNETISSHIKNNVTLKRIVKSRAFVAANLTATNLTSTLNSTLRTLVIKSIHTNLTAVNSTLHRVRLNSTLGLVNGTKALKVRTLNSTLAHLNVTRTVIVHAASLNATSLGLNSTLCSFHSKKLTFECLGVRNFVCDAKSNILSRLESLISTKHADWTVSVNELNSTATLKSILNGKKSIKVINVVPIGSSKVSFVIYPTEKLNMTGLLISDSKCYSKLIALSESATHPRDVLVTVTV
jgi:hypothetical protein